MQTNKVFDNLIFNIFMLLFVVVNVDGLARYLLLRSSEPIPCRITLLFIASAIRLKGGYQIASKYQITGKWIKFISNLGIKGPRTVKKKLPPYSFYLKLQNVTWNAEKAEGKGKKHPEKHVEGSRKGKNQSCISQKGKGHIASQTNFQCKIARLCLLLSCYFCIWQIWQM